MIESFVAKIKKTGNSLIVVIPHDFVKFCGLEEKDDIKIYIKKPVKGYNKIENEVFE